MILSRLCRRNPSPAHSSLFCWTLKTHFRIFSEHQIIQSIHLYPLRKSWTVLIRALDTFGVHLGVDFRVLVLGTRSSDQIYAEKMGQLALARLLLCDLVLLLILEGCGLADH